MRMVLSSSVFVFDRHGRGGERRGTVRSAKTDAASSRNCPGVLQSDTSRPPSRLASFSPFLQGGALSLIG